MSKKTLPQLIPLNHMGFYDELVKIESIKMRGQTLLFANILRISFCLLALILSPILFDHGEQWLIWSNDYEQQHTVIVLAAVYVLILSLLSLMVIKNKQDSSKYLIANAFFDAFLMMLFLLTFNLVDNWVLLACVFLCTILLSVLTLNTIQNICYALFLCAEWLFVYTIWHVFGQVNVLLLSTQNLPQKIGQTVSDAMIYLPDMSGPAIIFVSLAVVVFLVGYLATQSRNHKIRARMNNFSYLQTRVLNETIIAKMPAGLIVVNGKGEIIVMNQQARDIFHLRGSDLPYHLKSLHDGLLVQFSRWKDMQHNEMKTLSFLGDNYSLAFTALNMDNYATLTMITLENLEVSFHRVREARLASLGRLTAGIAHEIRNPLGSVQTANGLISEMTNDSQIIYLCDKISHNVKRIDTIISDILNMFRDDHAVVRKLLINQFLHDFMRKIQANDILSSVHIDLDCTASTDVAIYFEPSYLTQILHNLMLNAVTHGGREDLIISVRTQLHDNGHVLTLDIMDNGKGVREKDREKIFEPFYSNKNGTGLGLYLVREMCLANQAQIAYVKDPAVTGACFRITVECYAADEK